MLCYIFSSPLFAYCDSTKQHLFPSAARFIFSVLAFIKNVAQIEKHVPLTPLSMPCISDTHLHFILPTADTRTVCTHTGSCPMRTRSSLCRWVTVWLRPQSLWPKFKWVINEDFILYMSMKSLLGWFKCTIFCESVEFIHWAADALLF